MEAGTTLQSIEIKLMESGHAPALRLRMLRVDRHVSLAGVAEVLDLPEKTYDAWEQGTELPNLLQLIELADFYQVSIDYLLSHVPDARRTMVPHELVLDASERELVLLSRALDMSQRQEVLQHIRSHYDV